VQGITVSTLPPNEVSLGTARENNCDPTKSAVPTPTPVAIIAASFPEEFVLGVVVGAVEPCIRATEGDKARETIQLNTINREKALINEVYRTKELLYLSAMNIGQYLPSSQFMVIIGSVLLSGGLVVAAQQYTGQKNTSPSSLYATAPGNSAPAGDWLAGLRAIEGDGVGVPPGNLSSTTQNLLEAAQSSNITDTVARTLLINLSDAKSQGLGSDIPTQERLVAEAISQIQKSREGKAYTEEDLSTVPHTTKALKAYGNEVIEVIDRHPRASFIDTIIALGTAMESGDQSKLAELLVLQKEYRSLAKELLQVPTPESLVPFHLKIINNVSLMAETYTDMQAVFTDSLRGLAGFELYQNLNDETARVFTSVAQQFELNGILFSKDEPGAAWGLFLSSSQP